MNLSKEKPSEKKEIQDSPFNLDIEPNKFFESEEVKAKKKQKLEEK